MISKDVKVSNMKPEEIEKVRDEHGRGNGKGNTGRAKNPN